MWSRICDFMSGFCHVIFVSLSSNLSIELVMLMPLFTAIICFSTSKCDSFT